MKTIIAVLALLILTGCATQKLNRWVAENRLLAESGKIKWSEYYSNLYQKTLYTPMENKGETLDVINNMILVSQNYEAGTMNKEQFKYLQRSAQVQLQKMSDESSARGRAAFAEALRNYGNSLKAATPKTTNCQTFGNSLNCTSY